MSKGWIVGTCAAVALSLGLLFLTRQAAPNLVPTRNAPAHVPRVAEATAHERFTGVIRARESVDVTAPAEGRLAGVSVHIGDRVKRGFVMATIDSTVMRKELAVAEASVRAAAADEERANIELAQARERHERRAPLLSHDTPRLSAVSPEELATFKHQQEIAGAQVDRVHADRAEKVARLSELQARVEQMTIRAPFDGTISARYVDLGAMVGSSTPIVRIISSDNLGVYFAVPEAHAEEVVAGAALRITLEPSGESVSGVVENVAPEVDVASGMIMVEARVDLSPAQRARFRAGQVVMVEIQPSPDPSTSSVHARQ